MDHSVNCTCGRCPRPSLAERWGLTHPIVDTCLVVAFVLDIILLWKGLS